MPSSAKLHDFDTSSGFTDDILLFGDFNLPDVDWSSSDSLHGTGSANLPAGLASTHNLRQINSYLEVCRDLTLSLIPTSYIAAADDVVLVEEIHHPALSFSSHIHRVKDSNKKFKYLAEYRRSN